MKGQLSEIINVILGLVLVALLFQSIPLFSCPQEKAQLQAELDKCLQEKNTASALLQQCLIDKDACILDRDKCIADLNDCRKNLNETSINLTACLRELDSLKQKGPVECINPFLIGLLAGFLIGLLVAIATGLGNYVIDIVKGLVGWLISKIQAKST